MDPPAVYGCLFVNNRNYRFTLDPNLVFFLLVFYFYLIAGSPNNQIKNITNWLIGFLTESFEYLTYKTEQKPFPFDQDDDIESNDDIEEVVVESNDDLSSKEEPTTSN